MENRELIIPARFDSKDVLAGLQAVEESGQAAGDLGQAADAAAARFRRAHESVESALQEFDLLRRALRQATAGHGGRRPGRRTSRRRAGRAVPAGGVARDPGRGSAAPPGLGSGAPARDGQAGKTGGLPRRPSRRRRTPSRAREPDRPMLPRDAALGRSRAETDPRGRQPGRAARRAEPRVRQPSSRRSVRPGTIGAPTGGLGPSAAMTPDDRPGPPRRGSPRPEARATAGDLPREGEILADVRRRQGFAGGSGRPRRGAGRVRRGGTDRPERPSPIMLEWMTGGARRQPGS